jgi:sulfoxide reductase catalytic subunit YedY
MLIRKPADVPSSEITPESAYVGRREFLALAGSAAAASVLARAGVVVPQEEKPNSYEQITTYNNYYEFGTDKEDPSENAKAFRTRPWTVKVDGLVKKPGDYHLEDLLKPYKVEDRTYRLRCVEAWSMVIPWNGIPLANFIKRCEPTSKAKYIKFTTLYDPKSMPGVRDPVLRWPYVEGLRMDEAMHPLTILTVGLYGEMLPKQDGAPLRLAVPWKYGFKHIKSIVKIEFVEKEPLNTWQQSASNEYGFYANVNPTVDHPRWSQAQERRIGEFFMRKTMLFNGYGDQVASLYTGMDLRKNY